MKPNQLQAALIEIWGPRAYRKQASAYLGIHKVTLWRYLEGYSNIPVPVQRAVQRTLEDKRRTGRPPSDGD